MEGKNRIMMVRWLAALWMFLLGLGMLFAKGREDAILHYRIERALQLGYDTFGRELTSLSCLAAAHTFERVIPLLIFTILISLFLAVTRHLFRPLLDWIFRFWIDSFSVLPGLLFALSWSAFVPGNWTGLSLAVILTVLPYLLRYWDGILLDISLKQEWISAVALGADSIHLARYHAWPQIKIQLLSLLPFLFTRFILLEITLSFLGVGGATPAETWGGLLYQGKDYLIEAPWILGMVGSMLFCTLFSFHLLSKPEKF